MKKYFWLVIFLFIVSRFCFLANYPHFYDSPEYLRESLSGNFFKSLAASHEVIHPVWLFLTQIFQRIISQPTSWELSLISAIFGLISVNAFYFLIKRNFNQKVALFSLIPLIFFPHLWLLQTNVLHESLDTGLFLLSLLFFDFFLEKKKFYWSVLTVVFLSLAIFDFVGILIWLPAFIGLAILKSKKINWSNIGWSLGIIVGSFLAATAGLYGLLSLSQTIDPTLRLKSLLLGYGDGGIFSGWNILNILRMLRNDGLILIYGYSLAAILGLMITGVYLVKQKKWPLIIFLLTFFLPFIITGKFWYGGLFGRYSALVAYPLALVLALMPWRKIYWGLIAVLFLTFLPTFLAYQETPISEIQADLIEEIDLQKEDLLILSDYQRPQLVYLENKVLPRAGSYLENKVLPKAGSYINALYVNGDRKAQGVIEEKMREKLSGNGRVFVSQQAITFPYWQYDGQQIHIISKGNKNKAQLKEFLKDRDLKIMAEDKNYSLLTIYQIE